MSTNRARMLRLGCVLLWIGLWAEATAQVSTNARSGRFIRGNGNNADVQSIVLALDFQKGVALDPVGGNGSNWFGGQPLTYTFYHYNATNPASAAGTNGRVAYQVPIVAFGSRMGGSPLYVGTQYRFGASAGVNYWGAKDYEGTNYAMFLMYVYDKRSNYTTVGTAAFLLPRSDDTNEWTRFATNGFTLGTNQWGLRTTIADHPGTRWALDDDEVTDSYVLTHEAVDSSATNYLFEFYALGYFYSYDFYDYYAMSLDEAGENTWTELYSIEFETRPSGQVLFIDQPHFRGEPLPPEYAGKTVEELTNFTATVTNQIWVTNSTYLALDQSPELRQHPILDKFVADMRYDPLALTEFVLNEIELTDPWAEGETGQALPQSINLGGINRSALGTFLERQGSPWEQCALLVYLLRAAGQHAAYVFPTNNNLKMLDTRLSKLLRMQLKGAIEGDGDPYTTNTLITVNYPWVVANINSNRVVHIFPWLKDTAVGEGLNLYDYMPTNYDSGYLWARQYFYGDTNIFALSKETDVPRVLFPKFIEQTMLTNHPGISFDDLGVRAFDRKHSYARWEDLPRPTVLSNQTQVVVISNLVSVTNILTWMKAPFDTLRVQLLRSGTNVFDTKEMCTADLNARKFLLFTNAGKLNLWLAPYRPSITNQSSFTNDSALLNKQLLQANVLTGDTNLTVRVTHLRHQSLSNQVPSFGVSENRSVTNDLVYSKADVAGICLSMGRVTAQMLQPHMEDYWSVQRRKQTNSSYVPPREDYQGTAAYLVGMGYHEKNSRFDEINEALHKVQMLSSVSIGLGKLRTKVVTNVNKVQPGVDMWSTRLVLAANGTLRPDSEIDRYAARESFRWLKTVSGSAEEHAIINRAFGETNSISTVRLLLLAQRRSNTNRAGIVELHSYDYITKGNQTNEGYNNKLRLFDAGVWAAVTNTFFAEDDPDYATVFITPASITNDNGSYKGMGALIFTSGGSSSLISGNKNGGEGSYQSDFGVPPSSPYLDWSLNRSDDNSVLFIYNDPSASPYLPSIPTADMPTFLNGDWNITPSPEQVDFAASIRRTLNLSDSTPYPTVVLTERDLSLFGDNNWLRNLFGFASDPVNTLSGEFYIDAIDLTVPGLTPLKIQRNYLSQNRSQGHFGIGWKLSFTPHLVLTTNAQNVPLIYAAEPEGSVIVYRKTNDVWLPVVADNPALNNRSAQGIGSLQNMFNARIIQTNSTNYVLTGADGSVRRYEVRSYPIATNSTGALHRNRPYLVSWKDPQGNGYNFFYGEDRARVDWGELVRIEAGNGAFLGFEYDTYSRIINAWTADGRRVGYEYDAFGDLVKVTLPDTSQIEYEYQHYPFTANGKTNIDSRHLLTKEIKPDGRLLQNDYDNQRRVTNQWATVGPDLRLVRNGTFIYSNNFNLTNMPLNGLSGYTLVKDAYDRTSRYDYTNGLITSITNPLGHATLQDWFMPGETNSPGYYPRSLEKLTDSRGLQTLYRYDTNGNVTTNIVQGDLTGNGNTSEQATNLFSYNAKNLLTNAVDAVGNKMEYVYDATYPYLRQQVIAKSGATVIATNFLEYYAVTNQITNGTHIYTNIALGLLRREIRAYGSSDAATNEWVRDGRGFPVQHVQYTRTGDPAVTNFFVFNGRGEKEEVIDGAGRKTRTDHDAMSRPMLREVYEANQSVPIAWDYSYYNENGDLVWRDGPRYDPEDYVWNDHDGSGRHTQQIIWKTRAKADGSGVEPEPGYDGFVTSFKEYNYFGDLTRSIDPRGNYTTNIYDAIGRLIQQRFYDTSAGTFLATNGFGYEPGGEQAFVTNALGGVTETRYTSTGKPHYRSNLDSSTNGWRYYADGRLHKEFLGNGSYWETTYDDANQRVTKSFKNAAGTSLATNIAEMDRRGNVVRTMDAAHVWFTNSFDGLDRLKWTAGPRIIFTNPPAFTFPPPPPPVQQASTNFFDAAGIVLTNINALGEKTVTKKDALDRHISIAIYAANGTLVRTTATVYAANHHSSTTYAGSGASAIRTTLFTDNAGRPLLTLKYPNSGLTEFALQAYDSTGNRTELRECSITNGQVTTWATNFWTYDNLNRVRTETVKDGVTTTLKYDASGNLTNRVMPGNFEWRASYDTARRITKDYDISGSTGANTNTYLYYTSGPFIGLLQSKTDGRAVVCTYGYDQFLRLTTNAHDGPLAEHDLTVANTYDARGLLIESRQWFATSATGPSNYIARTYTPYQQLLSEANRIDGMLHSDWRQYWDNGGRRQGLGSMAFGYQFGGRADGSVSSVSSPRLNSGATYTYDTAGQLLTRSSGNSRVTTFSQRDGTGRPLAITTTVHGVTKLSESLSWRGDGRLLAHTVGRAGDFTNQQDFAYADWTRRVTEERLNLTGTQKWTNTFAYDGGQASKLGVLTKAGNVSQGSALWSGTADALHRIANETNNVLRLAAEGDVNGFAYVEAFLDGQPVPVTSLLNTNGGSWRANLELTPGAHQLRASALHPFMLFTAWTTNSFTNSVSALTGTVVYDASGQITQRIWKNGSVTNRIQTLTWDGKGRLFKLAERDTNNSGINWTATYDTSGRRLRTTSVTVTNGVTNSAFPTVISQYFDPEVAFLELGVDVNGDTTWKLYGPDLSGTYGGMNGSGGLEAIAPPPDLYCPVLPDARGNLHGVYDQRHLELMWFPSRVTGYGAVPGYRPNALGHGAMVDSSSAWRERWVDITGLIWLGGRYYDPETGHFLSRDPLGHALDPAGYEFANGDPVNYFDPDGAAPQPSGFTYSGGTITTQYSRPGTNPRLEHGDWEDLIFGPPDHPQIRSYPFDHNWYGDAVLGHLQGIRYRNAEILASMPQPLRFHSGRASSADMEFVDATMVWAGLRLAAGFTESLLGRASQGLAFRTGRQGEDYLRGSLGGEPQTIMTSLGPRTPDLVVPGAAREIKVGYVGFTTRIERQIAKDSEILARQLEGIMGYQWDFLRSANTGRIGADPRVLNSLTEFGINYTVHNVNVLAPTFNTAGLLGAGIGMRYDLNSSGAQGPTLGKK